MKERIKGLVVGLLIGATMVSTGVWATSGALQKMVLYNNIKITLDNKEIKPTDANGNYVEPFTIDGTTYLPVRAVSNALGLYVDWDANTNTVKLSTKKNELETNQEEDMSDVSYESFVEFVKTKGSYSDNKYGIQTSIPYHSSEKGISYGTITLLYDPNIDGLELQILEYYKSNNSNSTTMQFLVIDLPKKSDKYDWQFQYMIDDESYKNNDYFMASEGTLKANAESYLSEDAIQMHNIILGREITSGSSVNNVGMLTIWIPIYGNNIFSENGSKLSFEYFGFK